MMEIPKLKVGHVFACGECCGVCELEKFDFCFSEEIFNDESSVKHFRPALRTKCCKSESWYLWDEINDCEVV